MIAVAIGFALGVTAATEAEDAAVGKTIAQRIDDFEIAHQMKWAVVYDLTFDD